MHPCYVPFMKRSVNRTPGSILSAPVGAGIMTGIVGFSAAFSIVLGGLEAVGASRAQAASGLLALTVTMGAISIVLSWRYRMPITSAWSTPGAALLMTTATVAGGWPVAVGAFIVCGILLTVTGLLPFLARLVQRIPVGIAQAMLAGILLPLGIAPISALVINPLAVAPVLIVWLLLFRLRPQWAIPGALLTALIVIGVSIQSSSTKISTAHIMPRLEWTAPEFTLQACIGIALPLYIVTMASQNIPGLAVMSSFGYSLPWRASLTTTGIGTILTAPFGGHALNLAAISAALAAGPEAGPQQRRWIAGVAAGCSYIVLGVLSTGLATLILAGPAGVLPTIAGVALLSTFMSSIAQAFSNASQRLPAAITFLVAASGVSALGLSSAFWALGAGLIARWALSGSSDSDSDSDSSCQPGKQFDAPPDKPGE